MPPKPCVLCGTLVELTPAGMLRGLPFGCAPAYYDPRIPPHTLVVLPTICWECRGLVLLDLPKREDA